MHDLVQWILENWGKPIKASSIAVLVLLLIDKFGRRLITSQVKRLFHIQDKSEFKQYVANQQRIEKKINAIMEKEGIAWSGEGETDTNLAMNSSTLSRSYSVRKHVVRIVKKYMRWMKMNLSRIQIASFIVTASGFVKQATGYEFPNEYVDLASFIIWALFAAWGIYHSKKPAEQPDPFLQEGGE